MKKYLMMLALALPVSAFAQGMDNTAPAANTAPVAAEASQQANILLVTPDQASQMNLQTVGTEQVTSDQGFDGVLIQAYNAAKAKKVGFFSVNVVSMGNSATGYTATVTFYNK